MSVPCADELVWVAFLNDLDINDSDIGGNYTIIQDGMTLGNPQAILTQLASNLIDGSLVQKDRDENRQVQLTILVQGDDSQELADAEVPLILAANAAHTFTLSSFDGVAPTAVFNVEVAEVNGIPVNGKALAIGERVKARAYALTLTCLPFPRSQDLVTVNALTSGAVTTVVIADGTSTTGWSAQGGAVTTTGSSLSAPFLLTDTWGPPPGGGDIWTTYWQSVFIRTLTSTNMTATPNIGIAMGSYYSSSGYTADLNVIPTLQVNGINAPYLGTDPTFGYMFAIPPSVIAAVTTLRFNPHGSYSLHKNAGLPTTYGFDNVVRTSAVPGGAQMMRSVNVEGSERTSGSFIFSTAAAGTPYDMRTIILFTNPSLTEFRPNMRRQYGTTGTLDANMVSGSKSTIGGVFATIPAQNPPPGLYLLAIKWATAPVPAPDVWIHYVVASKTSGGVQQGETQEGSVFLIADEFQTLGYVSLPPSRSKDATTDIITVEFNNNGLGPFPQIDDVWLFHVGDPVEAPFAGRLSILRNVGKYAVIYSPDVENQGLAEAYTADVTGFNKRWAGDFPNVLDEHALVPAVTPMFTIITGAASANIPSSFPYPAVTLQYFPRWFQWPAL